MDREELLATLNLASSALARESESILPILAGFKFQDGTVVAYDDVISVSLPLDIGVKGVLPGHQLLKFLSSCSTKEVNIEADKTEVKAKCGAAKLTLPLTSVKDWPFKHPTTESTFSVPANEAFFRGLELCSSIVQDRGLASWLGGISFYFGKTLRLYSSSPTRDAICHFTIKELGTGEKVTRYIVPISFCKTALAVYKKLGAEEAKLYVGPTSMVLSFGERGLVFTKLIEAEGQNIAGRIKTILDAVDGAYTPITPELAEGLKRAGALASKDGICGVTVGEGKVRLRTTAPGNTYLGEIVKLKGKHPDIEITVNPTLLLKMLGDCEEIRFMKDATVAHAKDGFTYITANKV